MSKARVDYDGTVCVETDDGMRLTLPLRLILDNLDKEGLDAVIEHVTDGAVLEKAIQRLCGDALHYEFPTDARRAKRVLMAMEQLVLGTDMWGAFDKTEEAIRECILQDDRRERELPYDTRSSLISIAHGRSRRLRKLVSEEMKKLTKLVRSAISAAKGEGGSDAE